MFEFRPFGDYGQAIGIDQGITLLGAENLRSGIVTHTNSAYLVLVAIDENGRPIPVPAFLPATPEETAWFAAAQERRRQRLRLRERGTRG